jgi:DeoR family transcriptional regulator, fructose operon transcriptional repressor
MYAEERRQAMAELARREGRVDVAGLAERFGVTTETVRRDLTDLEHRGVVRRVHGGAIPVERFRTEPAVSEKATRMADEKQRIAKQALDYVPQGGTILLDAGTTTLALARQLPSESGITVVTNDVSIAFELASRPNVNVLMIGGRLRKNVLANVDDWAMRTLDDLSVDVAFIATNGVSVARGLSTPDVAEAAVKRAMVAAGRQVVLLADHTKISDEHFVRFADLADIDVFVTDAGLSDDAVARFRQAGLEVVLA